jgi:phage repressor protein C with HTH and peptisase S24 domain
MDIENEILTELKRRNISVKSACEQLGVSKQTFYNKIKASKPDTIFLTKVKDILKIDVDKDISTDDDSQSSLQINHKKPAALIPFYNTDFIAGNAELYYNDETIYPEYYMDVPEFSGSIAFRAFGDSMEPRIKSGNILFGVKRENWNLYLEYGQIYGVTCKDGSRYLKYIRKHADSNFLLLKSENPNYDDMDMPKAHIKNIWLINGWIDKRS